jgi:hypothetical protein
MIPFFSRMPEISTPVLWPKRWAWICAGLLVNIERVEMYYRLYPPAVPSSHFLIRLLQGLGISMNMPLARYYDLVDGRAKAVSMHMQITSSYAKGVVHDGIFYGEGSKEILLLDEDYTDFNWVHDNWQNVCPIKVLLHPKSDLRLLLPNGKSYSQESGLTVISINIAMLAVMYRAFTLAQVGKPDSLSPYQFIGGWVLPNMLHAHLDLALFNRYCNQAFERTEVEPPTRQHSFRLPNYEHFVDHAVKQVINTSERQHRNFLATLHGLPAIAAEHMAEVLEMPDIYATTQVDWALFAARTRAVRLLLRLCEPTAQSTDRTTMVRLMRAYARNNVKEMAVQMLPEELALQFLEDMNIIEQTMLAA